jgi:hypothetical protein
MSQFLWLDYSERERRKMLAVINLLGEHDTRDELGIGSVRDTIADALFPGTSTIMTRARYFLLVPWTYQRMERKRVRSAAIADEARRAEIKLINAIEESDDSDGNIGKLARATLKRLPSSIYWQGLGTWGIRTYLGSLSQYHRSLDRYYVQRSRYAERISERDLEHNDLVAENWHGGIVKPPQDFPDVCSLSLRRMEAEYLFDRLRLSPACSGSLLPILVAENKVENVAFVWQHPIVASLPPKLSEIVANARNFSEMMHGAALLYNLILAEQVQNERLVESYREDFASWTDTVVDRESVFKSWTKENFWDLIYSLNPAIANGTRQFIDRWWDYSRTQSCATLRDNMGVRRLIEDREKSLKKDLARLGNPNAKNGWGGDSGSGQMDYRWWISQRILGDILFGLEDGDA